MSALNQNRVFFVMWPDDQDASSSTHSASPTSPQAMAINGGSSSTSDEGVVRRATTSTCYPRARIAYPVVMSRQLQQMHTDLQQDDVVLQSKSHDDSADHVTEKFMPCIIENCSRCQIKDSEIRQLRKRVQALEEQLCRALGSKENSITYSDIGNIPQSSISDTVITVTPRAVPIQTHRLDTCSIVHQPIVSDSGEDVHVHVPENQMSRPISNTSDKKTGEDKIELLPGSNVFISASRLQQILGIVKTGKQLARKLMSIYWDRVTLAKSTLSASSQHYEQLDPTIVSAIKSYCVLFDSTVRKSEIHSTMIDKCVQARRPRRSSLKHQEQASTSATELEYHELHISPSFSLETKGKEHDETEVTEDGISNLS